MSDTAQGARQRTLVQFPTELDFAEIRDAEAVSAYHADDAGMESIGTLSDLVELSAYGSFGDAGLRALDGLRRLEQLALSSPAMTVAGVQALAASHPNLRSLTVGLPAMSPADLAAITEAFPHLVDLQLTTPSLSIEHLAALHPLDHLERLGVSGGGDFLGGDDNEVDPLTALDVLRRFPALKAISARWSNGSPMVGDHAVVAMIKKRPGLSVNGTWYDPSVFDGSGDGDDPAEPVPGDGSLVDLTTDTFDSVLRASRVALVEFCTSSPNICKRTIDSGNVVSNTLTQMAPMLKGRATIARVDLHLEPALGERFGVHGAPDLLLFRHGEQVGAIGASHSTSIMIQLKPLLST